MTYLEASEDNDNPVSDKAISIPKENNEGIAALPIAENQEEDQMNQISPQIDRK